ncbi:MAG TPA: class I SAM-dependent methyltransferase [Isosphaeraceae bacterium]|jgi:SAM-dependent methyltransferase|nr:class I SAM-dependent methyltransferase [Isosphaeraceae bacterium]
MEGAEDLDLVCPHCRSALVEGPERWACSDCGRFYSALRGVPDLRTAEDAFLSTKADWTIARRLDDAFDQRDFPSLLEHYFDLVGDVPPALRKRQVAHILTAPGRARQWLEALGPQSASGPILDLGCGSGSFLAALGARTEGVVGLDIAMRWLLVARKRLDEEGLDSVRLVCGCAERLPLKGQSVAAIVAGDVIEHVGNQAATLAEAHRVLMPGGRLVMASPNRFSLAPEPHVQVWGVGLLPRPWMGPYVRLAKGIDFRAVRTMSLGEWRRLLGRSPFRGGSIQAPGLPEGEVAHFVGLKRMLARAYNQVVANPVGQRLALRCGPLFHVVCTRSDAPAPAAGGSLATTPATRRPTRPTATRA